MPVRTEFAPTGRPFQSSEAVVMTVDEYETIRLIDYQGFNQKECAGYMNIARTTAQQIYNSARKKLSTALVEGRPFVIEGGEYRLCDGTEKYCGCGGCRCHRLMTEEKEGGK